MITVETLELHLPPRRKPGAARPEFQPRRRRNPRLPRPPAGKSTTQKILIRLLQGYEGRAEVLGREVRRWDKSLYEQVGVSFELPNHYARLTALENLRHFAAFPRTDHRPPPGARLGRSQRLPTSAQARCPRKEVRLNLARACIHRPRLLFLDEPTSGLDPGEHPAGHGLVRRLREEGTTVLVTTHNMSLADQLCDRRLHRRRPDRADRCARPPQAPARRRSGALK